MQWCCQEKHFSIKAVCKGDIVAYLKNNYNFINLAYTSPMKLLVLKIFLFFFKNELSLFILQSISDEEYELRITKNNFTEYVN